MKIYTNILQRLKRAHVAIPFTVVAITLLTVVCFEQSENLSGIVIRTKEVTTYAKPKVVERGTITARSAIREQARIKAISTLQKQRTQRIVKRTSIDPTSGKQTLHSAADDFPIPGNVIYPVVRVPNWGAMYTPEEWNRTYDEMPNSVFIAVPEYNINELTIPMNTLLQNREQNILKITNKLLNSTRHFGIYHLDSDEFEGKHAGMDIKLPEGTPFSTIAGGKVFETGTEPILGNYVIIEHRIEGVVYYSIYGHMQTVEVVKDQTVRSGQQIGTVGNTGASSGPHIHLQVNIGNPYWRSTQNLTREEAASFTVHPIEFIEQY